MCLTFRFIYSFYWTTSQICINHFYLLCVLCTCLCMSVFYLPHVHVYYMYFSGTEEELDPLELEFLDGCEPLWAHICFIGTKPGSYARTLSAFNCSAITPTPSINPFLRHVVYTGHWRDGSVAKSSFCFAKEPCFESQHSYQAAHNGLCLQFQWIHIF